ncbi:MAG TPA: 30S ribosome-binding factor RbfA [Longimicrobiales bacterium]|nr:30S ribosome-binding factor RbfA [Longimicrobiales bacterium]
MAGYRIKRVNEQLRREIAEILLGEVQDPRVGPVTVTGASAAPDLTFARVFVRVTGDDAEQKETLQGLRAASAFIRQELGKRLPLRRVPELRFEVDETLERAQRIEELLSEVVPEDPEGGAEGGEADPETDGGG